MGNIDEELVSSDSSKEDELSPALIKAINKTIAKENYTSHTIYKRKISTDGGNYMSLLYEVDIKGETSIGYKETNLFLKVNLSDYDKKLLRMDEIFSREIFVYTEVAKIFAELQNEVSIPDEEKYNFITCYNDGNSNALILENLAKKGFKTFHRMDIVPLKVMEVSIQQLATFHALSMVLERKNPDYYRMTIKTKIHLITKSESYFNFVTSMCKHDMEYLEEDDRKKVEHILSVYFDKFSQYLIENDKVKCLCHGDYRMNNILVKEVDGDVKKVIPVDYQICFYGNPVTDLIYFLFLSTDQQFRKDHMIYLKNTYFDSLRKVLKYFNVDVESIYPRKQYENDFVEMLDLGLMVSLTLLPLLYVVEDDVPEIKSNMSPMKLHDGFKERLEGVIHDFTQWGYL